MIDAEKFHAALSQDKMDEAKRLTQEAACPRECAPHVAEAFILDNDYTDVQRTITQINE